MAYGIPGAYFASPKAGFRNSVWVELIGFDCTAADFGVKAYLDTLGFVPRSISLHLTSIDFVNTYGGMETEYPLPVYACSYGGHPRNDDRERQSWTNWQMRGLVRALQKQGVKVYGSFFDMNSPNGLEGVPLFTELHPELLPAGSPDCIPNLGVIMIKRFADGTYYEDYLLEKLCQVADGYGLDGFQIADGLSSLRCNLWYTDCSDDLLDQAGIAVPEGVENRGVWLWENRRAPWLAFWRRRWQAFLEKLIAGLHAHGLEAAVNSAWTRDPLEALYRYGMDYRAAAAADALVVEDVSSDLAILATPDNHGYAMPYEQRKRVHYEFLANLMTLRAYLPELPLTPLFMIWDNQEQWDVLHHAPTAMQRAAAGNFCHYQVTGEGLRYITNGPHFCLGDALKPDEWDFIRLCLDNGYVENPVDVEGAAFLWSDRRMEAELVVLLERGICHSAHWLALLMRYGAAVHKIVRIEDLAGCRGDLVVTNPSLLPEEERAILAEYPGRVIELETESVPLTAGVRNPVSDGWPWPLTLWEPTEALLRDAAATINEGCNVRLLPGDGYAECTVAEVRTGAKTSRIYVDNGEYYYTLPRLETKREIRHVRAITKPEGYHLYDDAHGFMLRVPGRGVDILEVEYVE